MEKYTSQLRLRATLLSRRPPRGLGSWPWFATLALVAVSGAYWADMLGANAALPAQRERIFQGREYWRLFTALGAHADAKHLLSNSGFFFLLSALISAYFGWGVALALALLGGAAANAVTLAFYPPGSSLVGASGAIYLMAGFWVAVFCLVHRKLSIGRRLVASIGFTLALLFPTQFEPHVSYAAHGIGFILGAASGGTFFLVRKTKLRSSEIWEADPPEEPELESELPV